MSLLEKLPEVVSKYWDFNRNSVSPADISYGSASKYWWKCTKGPCGNHVWFQSPNAMKNIKSCPFCASSCGKVCPCKCNSLGTLYPDLILMWNFELNDMTPYDYLPRSNKRVWWKCDQRCGNHIWESKINSVTTFNTKCPFCANTQVCKCKCNSLAHERPDLMNQ